MTHREHFLKRYGLEDSYSLRQLSKISSVPLSILQQVYDRGIGAYKTNPHSVRLKGSFVKNIDAPLFKKLSKEQWAYARVYSFLDGNPKHDNDLRGGGQMEMYEKLVKNKESYVPKKGFFESLFGGKTGAGANATEVGGSMREVKATSLGDDDIRMFLGNPKIITYAELANANSIDEVLSNDYVILLYEDSPNHGHWTAVNKINNTIQFFDPYGGKPDSQQKWVPMEMRKELGSDKPYLTRLFDKCPYPVEYNDVKYQKESPMINNCGRHCCNFIKAGKKGLDLTGYYKWMKECSKKMKLDFDGVVCALILKPDEEI